MPTVIDSLLVELGLDSSQFTKGQKDAVLAFDKTKKYAEQSAKDIEDSGKKASTFFTTLKKEALELFAVYETAKSFIRFVEDVKDGNRELGFAAKQMNLTTEQLSGLQAMARLTGTSTESLTGSLQKFTQQYQQFLTNPGSMTGSPLFGYLSGLHMSIADLKDANTILLKLAEAVDKISDPARKVQFLSQIGLDADTIKIVIQGAENLKKLRAEAEKQVHINQEAVKAATELTHSYGELSNRTLQLASDMSTVVYPVLEKGNDVISEMVARMDVLLAEDVAQVKDDWKELGDNWDKMLKANKDFGKDFMGEFIAHLKQYGPQLLSTFKQVFGAVFDWLKTAFNVIWEKVFGFRPFSDVEGMGAVGALGGAGVGGSTGAASASAGTGPRTGGDSGTADKRTFWERHAPKALGGKDAPSTSTGGATGGGTGAGGETGAVGASGSVSEAMDIAKDQLRKEGVPEANLHNAAAGLVGNALAESGLDPNKLHDKVNGVYTGYGIYGARLERRDAMLSWLASHGYQKNSLEGQMRYMAHEAMSDRYPGTRRALTGTGSAHDIGHEVESEFEAPRILNDRRAHIDRATRAQAARPTSHRAWDQMTDSEVDAAVDAARVHAARHKLLQQLGKQHVSSLRHASQYALLNNSRASHDHSRHSSMNVGNVNVHTNATDAQGIASGMREALDRELLNNQANYGLA